MKQNRNLSYLNQNKTKLNCVIRFSLIKCSLFITDTIVYMAVTNKTDAAILQKDLKLLEEWENRSQMSFHPDKCNVLRVTWCRNLGLHPAQPDP